MRSYFIIILLLTLSVGCISPQIQPGNPAEYELPGIHNTTIYYLNGSSVKVVEDVINTTSFRIDPGENGEEINLRDPIAQDYSGNNVTFNISREVFFGRSYVHFDFDAPFSGFIAYTQSDGQDFVRPVTKNGSIRVVLPVNFTTGSMLLGIAQPEPDNVTYDAYGREVLIWDNPYPEHGRISVNYYYRSSAGMLLYFGAFLLMAALLIWGYYYFSIKGLKKKRERLEKGIKK
ncbi:MAG: hypothetical protein FIB08_17565 [Candidatus Methanoperedens sp.]|nr:hypothetical protein [Candidatus Methanoperedens sp.]